MALLEKQLFVKRSLLPGAGKGLFTKKFIKRGSRIVEYKGRISTWREVARKDEDNPFIFFVKRNHVIDAAPYKQAIARFANDANGINKIRGIRNNAEYIQDGTRIFITAKKDIEPGEEIFVAYGKEYWDAVRYNLRIARNGDK